VVVLLELVLVVFEVDFVVVEVVLVVELVVLVVLEVVFVLVLVIAPETDHDIIHNADKNNPMRILRETFLLPANFIVVVDKGKKSITIKKLITIKKPITLNDSRVT
jgi:hypothetical protein